MDGLGRVKQNRWKLSNKKGVSNKLLDTPFFCSVCGLFHVEHLLSAVRSEAKWPTIARLATLLTPKTNQ